MRKILAMLFACSMVLAGCIDITDDEVAEIVEDLIEVPGCNDATAYNYDENATNSNACLSEAILRDSVTQFVHLINDGPEWGETKGMVSASSEVDEDGATTEFSTTLAVSPDGMYTMIVMDMGMMSIEMGELMTANADGTTNFVVTWMGNTYQMNSAAIFAETWNEQNYVQDDEDRDGDHDGDHDGDRSDGNDADIGTPISAETDARDGHAGNEDGSSEGMDDHDDDHDDHDDDHDDDMDGDMGDDFDMDLPDTDVSLPENFDPATAMFELGLATANGYSFSTTLDDSSGYSVTMTFTLSLTFEVTQMVMVETDSSGMSSTSTITILDSESVETLLTNDDTLMHHALPFIVEPMDHDDDDEHDGHGGHDDHGDHDGHGGHDDHDGHGGHDDHDDDELPSESDMFGMLDANGDGLLTFDEIMDGLMSIGENAPTPEQALEQGDADESGGISWAEFVEIWNSNEDEADPEDDHLNNSPDLEAQFHNAFNNSDDDDSGELTIDELQDFIDQVSELSSDDHDDHERTFVCSSTVGGEPDMEIAFELVNNGAVDCGDGADEPQDTDPAVDSDEDGIVDNDVDNWFDCYNGDDIAMNLVNDGNEDCSMGEDEHDSEPWMMFDDCTDMSSSSPDGGSMWECFVDMDGDGTLTSEESMGMWYICQSVTMVDGDMWFCEAPPHGEDGLSEDIMSMYFDAADADGDGMLSPEEFSFLYSVFSMGEDPDVSVLLAILDVDGDGEVTASEYSDFINATASADTIENTNWDDFVMMIEMFDEDNSGGLDLDELEEMLEVTGDDDDHYVFYCSNDGEEYANSMGGILCPEGAGVVPTCPDGELCVCIDVDGSCDDGDDDWGYEDHGDGGHDNGHDDHDGHDDHEGHDHHGHGPALDWSIDSADMLSPAEVAGSFADYHIVLANCMMDSDEDTLMSDMEPTDMIETNAMTCGDDVLKVSIADATAPGADVMFHDADGSGTITVGDMIHINPDLDAGGDWNTVRLYSDSSEKYSDENPMLPGFGAAAGIIALLGAALIARRD